MILDQSGIFTQSIQSNNTAIIPVVVFSKNNIDYYISTNAVTMDGNYYEPLLLNIPSIRESVDFEKRNFKIGNISLSISNSAYGGDKRFSDNLPDIMNAECFIYYKTTVTQNLNDCLKVYQGKVKRMSHDDTTISLQVEDLSQENIYQTIPKKIVTDSEFIVGEDNVLSKYINKPYPMVYGEVKKSNVIIQSKNDGTEDFEVMVDRINDEDIDIKNLFDGKRNIRSTFNPIYIEKDNKFYNVNSATTKFLNYNEGDDETRYTNDYVYNIENNKSITLFNIKIVSGGDETDFNTISNNQAEVIIYENQISPFINTDNEDTQRFALNLDQNGSPLNNGITESWGTNNEQQQITFKQGYLQQDYSKFGSVNTIEYNLPYLFNINLTAVDEIPWSVDEPVTLPRVGRIIRLFLNYEVTTEDDLLNFKHYCDFYLKFSQRIINFDGVGRNNNPVVGNRILSRKDETFSSFHISNFAETYSVNDERFYYDTNLSNKTNASEWDSNGIFFQIEPCNMLQTNGAVFNADIIMQIHQMELRRYGLLDNIFNKNWYIDVRGRRGISNYEDDLGVGDYDYSLCRRTFINKEFNENFNIDLSLQNDQIILNNLIYNFDPEYLYISRDTFANAINLFRVTNTDTPLIIELSNGKNLNSDISENKYIVSIAYHSGVESTDGVFYKFKMSRFAEEIEPENISLDSNLINFDISILEDYIQSPADIITHILKKELDYSNTINNSELLQARQENKNINLSFTVSKITSTKKIIEKIAKQSKLFPKFKNDGSFGFNTIKDEYTVEDVETIQSKDIINYRFDKTKIEDIKTKIKIIYGKDNITGDFLKATDYMTASQYFIGYDNAYMGLEEDHQTSTLDFEAEYVQDEVSAITLRNFLLSWYANQHNIITVDLPLRYLKFEVGDVVKFDGLINNLKLYGEDYTIINNRNGQDIYPYFMIMETVKNINKITFKLLQLHKNLPVEQQDDIQTELNRSGMKIPLEQEIDQVLKPTNILPTDDVIPRTESQDDDGQDVGSGGRGGGGY